MSATKNPKKKRIGKKRPRKPPIVAGSVGTTPSSPSHLDTFFAEYAPEFQYDATRSAPWEFYRLCDHMGWDRTDPDRKEAHQRFKNALVRQFNLIYGTDVNDVRAWQSLCHVVHIEPIPEALHACREAVYYTFVNLVDLVDTHTTHESVRVFDSECALSDYTKEMGKYFPREDARGGVLQYLLRHIDHPREGYDTSHTPAGKRRGRR